jgi:hypothetical protein
MREFKQSMLRIGTIVAAVVTLDACNSAGNDQTNSKFNEPVTTVIEKSDQSGSTFKREKKHNQIGTSTKRDCPAKTHTAPEVTVGVQATGTAEHLNIQPFTQFELCDQP